MNIDTGFLYVVLNTNRPELLSRIERSWIGDHYKPLYDFILECLSHPDMRKLPRVETLENKFNIEMRPVSEDVGFFIKSLRERFAKNLIDVELPNRVLSLIQDPTQLDIEKASLELMNIGCEARKIVKPSKKGNSISLVDDISTRMADYERRENLHGILGISYPWDPLNKCMGGLVDGELSFVAGRSGTGKTWFALQCVKTAFIRGKNVLFVSGEMDPLRVTYRFDAMMAGISPRRFREGTLLEEEKDKLQSYFRQLELVDNKVLFQGQKDIKSIADLELYMAQYGDTIDMVIWDSAYLAIRKARQWEEKADFVKNLKVLAEEYNVPILITWQFNRSFNMKVQLKKDLTAAAQDSIAYTEAAYTDADNCIGLYQNNDAKEMDQMTVFTFKTRDGMWLKEMNIEWDHENSKYGILNWDAPGIGSYNPVSEYQLDSDDILADSDTI